MCKNYSLYIVLLLLLKIKDLPLTSNYKEPFQESNQIEL